LAKHYGSEECDLEELRVSSKKFEKKKNGTQAK
jgi:hypothetical protein